MLLRKTTLRKADRPRPAALALLWLMTLAGCGGSSISPSSVPPPVAGVGPRVLLAGASHAYFLQPIMPEAVGFIALDASIDFWLSSAAFTELVRSTTLEALVWTHGGQDAGRYGTEEYAQKLRTLIAAVRDRHAGLPVRVVELTYFPIRTDIIEAQRRVAGDPGVQMIPTADLPLAADGHLTQAGYEALRDRIRRSLGR
jgi:hypothetical protein